MPDTSPVLALPLIQPAQAQKHVTHNEALRVLDAVVQLVVIAAELSVPPAGAVSGDRYIVGASGSGAWTDHSGDIALYADGAWSFIEPQAGWCAQVLSPKSALVFDAVAGWEPAAGTALESTAQLGINATADATNRLSLSAPATLLNNEGAGHQLKINKATAGDTASLLYQTGFSGRAELGLSGNDDFAVKVSADGTAWRDALRVDAQTGSVAAPAGFESQQIVVAHNAVSSVAAPTSGGFVFLSVVSDSFPQASGSMALCYDVGPSPQLFVVWAGSAVSNLGNTLPTGTSASDGDVGVAVQSDGRIYLENRHVTGNALQYCVTWLNGWRALA